MEHPARRLRLVELSPVLMEKLKDIKPGAAASGTIERTIAEDGSVEIRYPDGTVKRFYEGGFTVVSPQGLAMTAQYLQVQADTPASLPSDVQVLAWLEWSNESLLEFIRTLVDNNEMAVSHYLQREQENTENVYEQMRLRTKVVGQLLTPE